MSKKTQELKEKKNKKQRIINIVVGVILAAFIIWIIVINTQEEKPNYTVSEDGLVYVVEGQKYKISDTETDLVLFNVKNFGVMVAELYPEIAPITVKNFKELVSQKFYDNLIFHRVIDNFVVQVGDPTGTGEGGSEKTIKGEFALNGVENNLSHKRGVLSMARRGPQRSDEPETEDTMNSASSQIFIVQKETTYLDGKYAGFGKLVHGYDVLDKISRVQTDDNQKPLKDVTLSLVRFVEEE